MPRRRSEKAHASEVAPLNRSPRMRILLGTNRFELRRLRNPPRIFFMEFEWFSSPEKFGDVSTKEVEESFEDPFSIRLLPEIESSAEARYFLLGRALSGRGLFTVFWTDGKRYRVIFSRPMAETEENFYDRKNADYSG